MAFLSGSFKGSQLRWATVDKERFATVNTFRRLEYLLWGGVHIFTDHRNLTYIFNPEACVTSVTKTIAQRLGSWTAVCQCKTRRKVVTVTCRFGVWCMVYWAIRLQSALGSVCVMSRVGFHSVSLVLLISCLHALADVRQPIIHEL